MTISSVSVIGNCQIRAMSDFLAAMLPQVKIRPGFSRDIVNGDLSLSDLADSDVLIVQSAMRKQVSKVLGEKGISKEIIYIPTIYFSGFHPDFIYIKGATANVVGPLGTPNSAIALAAWKSGLSAQDTVNLFNDDTYAKLGYHDFFRRAEQDLLAECTGMGLDIGPEYERWKRSGPFVHVPNHPKSNVLAGICRTVLKKIGCQPAVEFPELLFPDVLASSVIWPIYPELVRTVGGVGSYVFKPANGIRDFGDPVKLLDLREFIEGSFEAFGQHEMDALSSVRLNDPRYREAIEAGSRKSASNRPGKQHPYRGLPPHQFWRKSVSAVEMNDFDPVVNPRTKIDRPEKIATAGSCFAQHIARHLNSDGFNYFVPENGSHLDPEARSEGQFGLFSCRYGNIYTAAQLNQLFDRSQGTFEPLDRAWQRDDGRFVDPFRPRVEASGFESEEAVEQERKVHLDHVREMWSSLDIFIFTLGLTEAWRAKADKAVFPLAPGVSGGDPDLGKYEFHNFTVEETTNEMAEFLEKLKSVNPGVKVILTVSPVPLEATFENRNVLVSTAYSKSVLRTSAEQISNRFDFVEYFPSYEIITGNYNRGAYFAEDLREVLPEGVSHVMKLFKKHHTVIVPEGTPELSSEFLEGQNVICDEEMLGR